MIKQNKLLSDLREVRKKKMVHDMNIEKAPYMQRNSREGRLSRSTESTKTFFKFTLINAHIIRDAITPRAKVS